MKIVSARRLCAVLLLVLANSSFAAQDSETEILSLQQAIQLGLQQSPGLAAARATAIAVAEQVPQAGGLPDPRLSFGLANLPTSSFSLDQDPMSQIQVGISQELPYPGKLALQEEVAQQQAQVAALGSDEARLRLVRDVKQAWWQLFYQDRAIQTIERNRTLLLQQFETAQTQYTVGHGQQQDVLLIQLELAKLDDDELRLIQARADTMIRLNSLLNRSPLTPIVLPQQVVISLPELPDIEKLQDSALSQRPDLHARQAQLEAARSRRELSARDRYPDFNIAARYGKRDSYDDLASIQFSMSLPIYAGRKQSRAEDQRQAELIAQQEHLRDAQIRAAAEVASALVRYQRSRDQVTLFDVSILPQARQTIDVMLAGYQVNKVGFLNLVRAQTTLHNYETDYWQAYAAAHQALAELAAALGQENIDE